MKYVTLPDDKPHDLPFYLAMEEFLATNSRENVFFMWQVDPTVIFGRNQVIEKEVNLEYCRANNIRFYRRKSGGGCVFADRSNIMFSFITTATDIPTTFAIYSSRVAEMLQSFGLPATASGRNDVLINGRKVSGNAFYRIADRSIIHGTMLYDTNLEHMSCAISPSDIKLSSKGVGSVRSHVTTLNNEKIGVDIETFKQKSREYLCNGEIYLTDADINSIKDIAADYYSYDWIYGNNPHYDKTLNCHIGGVGEFTTFLSLDDNKISDVSITGDFFPLSPVDTLIQPLKGIPYNHTAVAEAVKSIDLGGIIRGLDRDNLIKILF